MHAGRIAVIGVSLGAVVAACYTTRSDEPNGKPGSASQSDPASGPKTLTPQAPAVDPTWKPLSALSGPRIADWSSSRVTGRATQNVLPQNIIDANKRLDPKWSGSTTTTVTTGAGITAAGAVYGANWIETTPSASDMMYFGVNGTGSSAGITGGVYSSSSGPSTTAPAANFFALKNLYASTNSPVLAWSTSLGAPVDRTGVALSYDGTRVYVIDTGGTLHCLVASSGANCSTLTTDGGPAWHDFTANGAVHGSSPWVNYTPGTYDGDIYFGDDAAYVYHINGVTGAAVWSVQPGPSGVYQGKFESAPVVFNGYVFIGDDLGQVFRLTDAGPPVSGSGTVAIFNTCSAIGQTAPCPNPNSLTPGPWAVRTPVGFDVFHNHVYATANDYVFELNGASTGTWAGTAASPKHLNSGVDGTTNGPMLSPPIIDSTPNPFLWLGFDNQLFKLTFPFTGSTTSGIYGSTLQNQVGGTAPQQSANPTAGVLPYNGAIYVPDMQGYEERFDCATQAGSANLDGLTGNYGTSAPSTAVLDYSTGNTNFGTVTSTGGQLVQFPLGIGSYTCPTGTQLCTGSTQCVATGGSASDNVCLQCCSNTDCAGTPATPDCQAGICVAGCTGSGPGQGCVQGLANTTVACNSGACSYTCVAPYANCSGSIVTNGGCNTLTTSDINNCGGCGNACSNNHLPVPACTSTALSDGGTVGVCTGHCADGYVDCDGNRLTNGCETAASCAQGGCCGTSCAAGAVCYDNGGTGTCVMGQTTQAYNSNSEHNNVTVTCPTGQPILGVTFADFGSPDGVGGQSWSTASACASQTNSTSCGAAVGCLWNATLGVCATYACQNATTQSACTALSGCNWAELFDGGTSLHDTTGTCTSTLCASIGTQGSCPGTICSIDTTQSACNSDNGNGCVWDSALQSCLTACAWDSSISVCTSSVGFLHNYGTYPGPANTECAMDVSASTALTGLIDGGANSLTIAASNGIWTPGNGLTLNTANTPLPLNLSGGYYTDPCNGVYKALDLQVTCGSCQGVPNKYMFVSNTTTNGAITSGSNTGAAAGNAICNSEASAAGLPGTYQAWLGTGTTAPASWTAETGPIGLPDGTLIASTWATLLSGTLSHAINESASGAATTATAVWTGTDNTGTAISGKTCNSFLSGASGVFGEYGDPTSTSNVVGSGWQAKGAKTCNTTGVALYCIEQ